MATVVIHCDFHDAQSFPLTRYAIACPLPCMRVAQDLVTDKVRAAMIRLPLPIFTTLPPSAAGATHREFAAGLVARSMCGGERGEVAKDALIRTCEPALVAATETMQRGSGQRGEQRLGWRVLDVRRFS